MVYPIKNIGEDLFRILLTNDDGFHAEGIQTLYSYLKDIARVTIVAPDRERSAVGHGITMYQPLRVSPVTIDDVEHWIVDGTPSDCVKLAIDHILKDNPPHLLISGINRGPNLGNDVLYSGTVSAALEGTFNQIPSIAASLLSEGKSDYRPAAIFIRDNLEKIKQWADTATLNINFPEATQYKGIRWTTLGKRLYNNVFEERKDPRGKTYFWMAGEPVPFEQDQNSDITAVETGFVSITPLNPDITHYSALKTLNS